jgi:hypothetical protein
MINMTEKIASFDLNWLMVYNRKRTTLFPLLISFLISVSWFKTRFCWVPNWVNFRWSSVTGCHRGAFREVSLHPFYICTHILPLNKKMLYIYLLLLISDLIYYFKMIYLYLLDLILVYGFRHYLGRSIGIIKSLYDENIN